MLTEAPVVANAAETASGAAVRGSAVREADVLGVRVGVTEGELDGVPVGFAW